MQYKYKHIIARNLHFVNDANYICRHFVPVKSEGQHHNMFLRSCGVAHNCTKNRRFRAGGPPDGDTQNMMRLRDEDPYNIYIGNT